MRVGKLFLKALIIGGFIVLLVFPVIMMKELSESEKEEFRQNNVFEFKEAAYGEGRTVTRTNIGEYVVVNGVATSNTYEYIDVSKYMEGKIKYIASIGEEIHKEEVIATVNNIQIKSPCNGILEDIVQGEYIKLRNIDKLKLLCTGDGKSVDKIKDGKNLHLENGEKLAVDRVSNVATDNMIEVELYVDSENFMYGQTFTELKIFTGTVYEDALVVDKDCVYQKYENGPFFIRVLNEKLLFEGEVQVQVGFETDEYISVVNVEEGTICDAGYKELIAVKAGMK